jgi:thiol-disulfide isomerase/thioredoxin
MESPRCVTPASGRARPPRAAIAAGLALFVAAALALPGPCRGADPPAAGRTAGSSGAWPEAPGYEVSILGDPGMQARVFQSADYRRLLVHPDRGSEAWVLDLVGGTVAGVPRAAVKVTPPGAVLDASAAASARGSFARAGAEISFKAGSLTIQLAPQKPLVGEVSLATLLARKKDYVAAAAAYRPDPVAVAILKNRTAPVDIVVFFGTWCSNCKRWLPTFIRTMELAANPRIRVRYVAVDEDSNQPRSELNKYKIDKTPTFILLVKGREVGRIVERPRLAIEKDLVDLLAGVRR